MSLLLPKCGSNRPSKIWGAGSEMTLAAGTWYGPPSYLLNVTPEVKGVLGSRTWRVMSVDIGVKQVKTGSQP